MDESSGVFDRISNVVTAMRPRSKRSLAVRILFEPRDLWVGLYWDKRDDGLYLYVCIIPMLPLLIVVRG